MNNLEVDKELFNFVLKQYVEGELLVSSITTRMTRLKKGGGKRDLIKYITLGAVRHHINFLSLKPTEM